MPVSVRQTGFVEISPESVETPTLATLALAPPGALSLEPNAPTRRSNARNILVGVHMITISN